MSDNITSILNDLVETSKDGEKGFRAAAEDTKNHDFDSEFTLEPRGDQVAMTPRTAGFDLPAALPAAEDRRRASACERA